MKSARTRLAALFRKWLARFFLLIDRLNNWLVRWLPRPIKNMLKPLYARYFHSRYGRILDIDRTVLQSTLRRYKNRPYIIFAPSLDWNVQLFQRPQQLAIALARQGALVFYIQPKPDRKQPPVQEISENLLLCNVFVEAFDVFQQPWVYFLTWNCGYLNHFKNPRLIYDYVDEIQVFYADQQQITEYHKNMLVNAEIVLVTAKKLLQDVIEKRQDVVYCPNAVDYAHFAVMNENDGVPADLADLVATGKPIVGYYGALARWFDYDLLKRLSTERPDLHIVLIGPDYDGTLEPACLGGFKNIHWLGVKPYAELPMYLRRFDVATIPFLLNDITHATSPLKLFEYMAGKKPVVITAMHESMRYEGVLVAIDADDFVARIDQALALKNDAGYLQTIDRVAQENTWDARARQILDEVEKRLDRVPQP